MTELRESLKKLANFLCGEYITGYYYVPAEDDAPRPLSYAKIERVLESAKDKGYVVAYGVSASGVWWNCAPGKKSRHLHVEIARLLPESWQLQNDS